MRINKSIKKCIIGSAFACAIAWGSGTAGAVTFNYGDFNPGNEATSPPGTSYDFTGLPFSFTTTPLAFQWGYVIDGNPTPQDPGAIKDYIEDWTGLSLTALVQEGENLGSTGFSTSIVAEIIAVHLGQGELVFIFNTATLFTLSNYVSNGYGLSNFRTYNFTDNDDNQGPPQVPLPAGIVLLISALGGLGFLVRFRKAGAKS